jgi:hypothetical protein
VDGSFVEDVNDGIRYGLHSMLNSKSKAPIDVRAKEVYHSIQGGDGADVMTARAMAMLKFKHDESVIKRATRGPRWR